MNAPYASGSVAGGVGIMSMDYLGGFHYQGTALKFFPTAEGYVQATALKVGFAYSYVYNYTDHLGNIRLSYAQDPENPNALKIIEESHYYPFGLKHANYNSDQLAFREKDPGPGLMLMAAAAAVDPVPQFVYNYKYNGKEFQDEMGLNWYDYGARNYDPAIGRWMNVDPLAEIYHTDSPYVYVLNNPLSFIDPDGRRLIGVTKDDAKNIHDDINNVFADSKFDKVRALLTRGKKNESLTFDKINNDALKEALSGLKGDDLALAELVTNAVNSSVEYKVEYVETNKSLSTDGESAYNSAFTKIYTDNGIPVPNFPTRKGSDIAGVGGEGYNVPIANGSHSFILNDKSTKHAEGRRELTSFHEIFGHGVPSGQKASDVVNNTNAIRAENLVRRVLNIQTQRDGADHTGGKVSNPSTLPIIKN